MVAGKHAVALLTNFSQALSVSGGKIHFLGFPAGQKGKGFLAAGQINQRNAAELLALRKPIEKAEGTEAEKSGEEVGA